MSFASQVQVFSRGSVAKVNRMHRGIVLKLFGAVIMDTPVLTGRLRANWRFSQNVPDLGTNENALDPQGTVTIGKVQSGMRGSSATTPVFLSNSLPYAHRIEFDGWSHTKAPEGMMRRNVARFDGLVKEAV